MNFSLCSLKKLMCYLLVVVSVFVLFTNIVYADIHESRLPHTADDLISLMTFDNVPEKDIFRIKLAAASLPETFIENFCEIDRVKIIFTNDISKYHDDKRDLAGLADANTRSIVISSATRDMKYCLAHEMTHMITYYHGYETTLEMREAYNTEKSISIHVLSDYARTDALEFIACAVADKIFGKDISSLPKTNVLAEKVINTDLPCMQEHLDLIICDENKNPVQHAIVSIYDREQKKVVEKIETFTGEVFLRRLSENETVIFESADLKTKHVRISDAIFEKRESFVWEYTPNFKKK